MEFSEANQGMIDLSGPHIPQRPVWARFALPSHAPQARGQRGHRRESLIPYIILCIFLRWIQLDPEMRDLTESAPDQRTQP